MRHPSKLHGLTRSGLTVVFCHWSTYNFLVGGGFLYPRTPAEPISRTLGYTVRGGIEAGGQMKCPRTAGLGYANEI